MAGIIKVNQYQDFNGNTILTSDGSGNLTTQQILYPAFEAHSNTAQSLSDNTYAKVDLQIEILDTNNNFNSSRFTPTVPGQYYFEGQTFNMGSNNTSVRNIYVSIYKNGSQYKESRINFHGSEITFGTIQVSAILNMNGSSDYVELYAATDVTSGSASLREGTKANYFLGYRIGS